MRNFLTRQEATYKYGLMDAAQRKEPLEIRVACKDRITGKVYEAIEGEFLHAQITIREGLYKPIDGWTEPCS